MYMCMVYLIFDIYAWYKITSLTIRQRSAPRTLSLQKVGDEYVDR